MLECRSCSGESASKKDKRKRSDCTECVAETLIKDNVNELGILSLEACKELCKCFKFGHKKESIPQLADLDESYNQELERKRREDEQKELERIAKSREILLKQSELFEEPPEESASEFAERIQKELEEEVATE